MPSRYEFDECSGYDCMYGGFDIYDRNNSLIVTVDLCHFGQEPCEHPIPEAAKAKAEAIAKVIVDALNQRDQTNYSG